MLIHLNKRISVEKLADSDSSKWICYEALKNQGQYLKGTTWKRISGLFSASEMRQWLDQQFADKSLTRQFNKLAQGK